ncbi:hypothetical protein NC653_009770 [Populus alba x Populus x berolinensis]|uniref:Uncharacterized protein n=1 Tax=Populus alba x Populus x berolinensis TaxID=444605 RepID=A0AAD6R9W3_9ROSI|nr:hypothetical protein NC653_009770 [Populus alba x Populus x berolinensis]
MPGCCGLEVSSWFVWLAARKRECRGAFSAKRRRKRTSLGGAPFFFLKEGVQPAGLKEMGLGFCGCPNFLSLNWSRPSFLLLLLFYYDWRFTYIENIYVCYSRKYCNNYCRDCLL